MRTTHIAGGGAIAAAFVTGALLAGGGGAEAPDQARVAADAMTVEQLVGQRIVTGYIGPKPPRDLLRAVRRGRVGGVILFGDNIRSRSATRRAIARMQREAKSGKQPPLLVMVDQEGGDVKRLSSLPPRRSPAKIGRAANVQATARGEGLATGRALAKLGFNVDLAPVADVPDRADSFLGTRAFSRDPGTVATAACAFADGLRSGGAAATFKHFPGLGHARANTDDRPVRVNATPAQIDADLEAYRHCGATLPLAMVASGTYPKLGINTPAVLTAKTYDLLAKTGFVGLTISDALGTPAIARQRNPAVRAVRAGLDLLLYTQTKGAAGRAFNALRAETRSGRLTEEALRSSATEIIALKNSLNVSAASPGTGAAH